MPGDRKGARHERGLSTRFSAFIYNRPPQRVSPLRSPTSCQCFLLAPTGQSLLLFSLRPMPVHLLPLAFGSLWYQAPLNLSVSTTAAARAAIRPATLKNTVIRTDGSKTYMNKLFLLGAPFRVWARSPC